MLDDVRRHVALSHDSADGLEVTPMLLLGKPGIGKTHFAKQMADLIGTGMNPGGSRHWQSQGRVIHEPGR